MFEHTELLLLLPSWFDFEGEVFNQRGTATDMKGRSRPKDSEILG